MNNLQSIPISEQSQVEIMRHIYNDNLDMLATRPIPYRTYEEQQRWWNENNHKLRGFLYKPIDQPEKFVAFLVLTNRGLFDTPIIAIKKDEWGSGYGQEIVNDYIAKANRPLAGSQLQSNRAICHINKKVGWQIVGQREESNGIVDLLYHPGINTSVKNPENIYKAILLYHEILK
jgi:RimJ/RimL family protein N-acetyltransferase